MEDPPEAFVIFFFENLLLFRAGNEFPMFSAKTDKQSPEEFKSIILFDVFHIRSGDFKLPLLFFICSLLGHFLIAIAFHGASCSTPGLLDLNWLFFLPNMVKDLMCGTL